MRRQVRMVITLLACLASPLASQVPGAVRGLVLNQQTSAPVAGALVLLREVGLRSQTNDNGQFVLADVPPGDYTVTATFIGFTPLTARVRVTAGATAQLTLRLDPAAVNLRDLVVTASKTETERRDVPAAVSVVSGEDLEQRGVTDFSEAVHTAPGVSVGAFGENFNSVQLRGLPRFGSENEAVLILLDGVPQTDARNSAQLLTLPIENIDRIEVVKGPNSAIYGRTAIGGVVNIITKDPGTEPGFRARFEGGQWQYVHADLTASGPLSAGGSSGYLLSWMGERHESFHDVNPINRRQSSLFGKFTSALDSATHFVASVNYVTNRGGTAAGNPLVDGELLSDIDPAFSRFTNLNLPQAQYNEEHVRAMGKIERDLGAGVKLANTFGYRHSLYNFVNDGDFLTPPTAASDTVILFSFTRPREENAYFDDLRLELNAGPERFRHRVLLGGTLDRNTGQVATQYPFTDSISGGIPISYRNPVYPSDGAFQFIDRGSRSYAGTFYGLYLQDEIVVARRLRLTLGGRYDANRVSALPDGGTEIKASFHKFSPKAGASYRVIDSDDPAAPQLSVYAQYSRAFKPPRAPTDLSVALDPATALKAEDITNYEGGLKATVLQGRLALEASAFNMLRDGIPVLLRVGTGLDFKETNGGKQRFKGIELGAVVRPITALSLHANYAFYDGKYEDFKILDADNNTVDLSGFRVNLSPRDMLDVGGTYDLGRGVGITLAGNYEGNKALDPKNTYFLDSYFTLDGRVNWGWRNYTFAVSTKNIFDTKYATDGEITDPLYIFPGPPRRVIVEFGAAF
jgi:iron complex outermembrane receptor protein